MNSRASRSIRRSAAPEEEDLDAVPAEPGFKTEHMQNSRRKKRRTVSEPVATADGSTGAYEDATQAAAAACAGPRQRQPRIPISQQDTAKMEETMNKYKEEAQAALDKALDLGVARTNVDQLVAKVVRMMLFKNYEKPGVPVKREDLIKEIQKDQKGGRGAKQLPSLVLPIAAAKLASVFGLEMLELKRGAATAARAAAGEVASSTGGVQTFLLRSLLQPSLVQRFVQDSADDPARGLMTVVAALLELAPGKQMDAEELSRHLTQLGVLDDPAEYESLEQMNVFGKEKAAGVLAHMEKMRLIVKKHVVQQQVAAGGATSAYELAEAAHEPEFKAGIKKLLDQWLGPTGSTAPATAATEGTEVQ